jgi:uncharacterized repeat protein (TIGR01451 family)
MKFLLNFIVISLIYTSLFGQTINTSQVSTANCINSQFAGAGVSIYNIKVNGVLVDATFSAPNIGYFTNSNPIFPFSSGIAITTGSLAGLQGPNNSTSMTSNNPPTSNVSGDPHLSAIANGTVNNGMVLEFDFIPVGDSVSFNYIFGSEEYPEFSPSAFNDAFGMFLWGPNVSGPYQLVGYTNGGKNIATLPNGLPVTINNVGDESNTAYYIPNDNGSYYGDAIQYDGTTVELVAGHQTECGGVYHLKIVIANVGDQAFDSGVLLESGSFTSSPDSYCGHTFGSVFFDYNENCVRDYLDNGAEGINLTINPGNHIVTTGPGGFWFLDSLSLGSYSITVDTTNLNLLPSCLATQNFTLSPTNVLVPDFGLVSTTPCSDPDVSIYAPFLRPCLPNQMIYVSACNQLTATGVLNSSYVDVELDPLMSVTNSSLPITNLGNNIYRFQIGDLYPGQCVNFSISTTISSSSVGCADLLDLTLCMEAELFPIEPCTLDNSPSDPVGDNGSGGTLNGFPQPCILPWDQSSLSVDGWCQGDSVYFSITNTGQPGGGDMECYSPMWITIDGVLTYSDSILIPGGETITLSYPANGQAWILNAEQHPLHPGNSHPNAHVEACGDSTNWTSDNINDFPLDDADPTVDIYCGIVTGSYDPNDKTGYPIGQTDQKYIQPNQQLQYVIRFQNTGTDTAFTVVIRDTLDTDLNIFTVTPGVASHPYEFKMYGPRVLEWTFNNINLPDSSTNQIGSNGFATFHVEQVPNLSSGTEITNSAGIYFDFNDPIITNTTIHRIFEGFVESVLQVDNLDSKSENILIYPNPTNYCITIRGEQNLNQSFSIFDQMGRLVFKGKLNGLNTEVNLSILSKGVYTLKIDGNFKPAQIVKE